MAEHDTDARPPQANPGYAIYQLARAQAAAEGHEDPAARERARRRAAKWTAVLKGMLGGMLGIGSRTPVANAPGWATLDVVTGGFATGELLADGPLLPHEQALLRDLARPTQPEPRSHLNAYFVSEPGMELLRECLRSGRYDVGVPEEGALLVAAWLHQAGHEEEARVLIATIAPYFSRLRFYPMPRAYPQPSGQGICVQTVGDAAAALEEVRPNRRIVAQKEAVEVWAPLHDRMVGLFLQTVAGETPRLERGPNGERPKPAPGIPFPVVGGWPCQHYPERWSEHAALLAAEFDRQRAVHTLCSRAARKGEWRAELRSLLGRCAAAPASLSGREVGRIRLILACFVDKRGTPESAPCRELREQEAAQVAGPTHDVLAHVAASRLRAYPADAGLEDIEPVLQPVRAEEAPRAGAPAGTAMPPSVRAKVERCRTGTAEELVERGIIPSPETLARVLPQVTSHIHASGIADLTLRSLYAAVYRAFRRRRSLLLLNLESQIRIGELPWVAAIDRMRGGAPAHRDIARRALEEVACLTLTAFPHVIVPNKLVKELRALCKGADLDLPTVDELAADIFMGQFSGIYVRAAKLAAGLLDGTLYAAYYGIDWARVRALPDPPDKEEARGARGPDRFAQLCAERAGVPLGTWRPATNGMVLEQEQILTTHNLAALVSVPGLREDLRDHWVDMARRCFAWVCRRQQMKVTQHHAQLVTLKNTAYAWRQMVFYLSLLPPEQQSGFVAWAEQHLGEQRPGYRARFQPVLDGLAAAAGGGDPGARRFLGWSDGRHWLLG